MGYRRLAYQRSWFLIVVGITGLALVAYASVELYFMLSLTEVLGIALLGTVLSLLILARGITGSWSRAQMRVDIAAGLLRQEDGTISKLDEIGELKIVTQAVRGRAVDHHRTNLYWLYSVQLDVPLYNSMRESETKRRLEALHVAVIQSRVRRVLERPHGAGAFRGGPEQTGEVVKLAGSGAAAAAALRGLQRDDEDLAIRTQASTLLAQLEAPEVADVQR